MNRPRPEPKLIDAANATVSGANVRAPQVWRRTLKADRCHSGRPP